MPPLLYRCPRTGMHAQAWFEIDDDQYESAGLSVETVVCTACGQLHLVDPKTGRVIGISQ